MSDEGVGNQRSSGPVLAVDGKQELPSQPVKIGGVESVDSEIVEESAAKEAIRFLESWENLEVEDLHYGELKYMEESRENLFSRLKAANQDKRKLIKGIMASCVGCPMVVPKCVYISKENVLQQALESLSLEIQETKSCSVGNDQIIAFMCINVPPHGKYSTLHQKKIFGDYKLTTEDALESAKLATLLYLQEIGIIFVDDINLSEVTKCEAKLAECQWKLLAASNWANMFQEETESLKAKLNNAYKENEKLIAAAKAFNIKKKKLTPQGIEVKEEVSAAQASSPPSFNHRQRTNVSGRSERPPMKPM